MEPLIARIDHIFVPVDEPEYLFHLFTERLNLPVAWPLTDFGPFRSGGVSLGNANLEVVHGDGQRNEFFDARLPATVRGIAFEPAVDAASWNPALSERELDHSLPFDFDGKWTTCGIAGLVSDVAIPFLCAYSDTQFVQSGAGGGVLGVEMLDEITIGVQDADASVRRWQQLLEPLQPEAPGTWRPGGPRSAAVRVHESPITGVAGITLKVRDVEAARSALKERGLLGPSRANGCGLRHPDMLGLDVWLTR